MILDTKHTEGPWKVDGESCRVLGPQRSEPTPQRPKTVVAQCSVYCTPSGEDGFGYYEARANARLIAAAPELLEALKRYFSEMEIGDAGQRDIEGFEVIAYAAISKAESK